MAKTIKEIADALGVSKTAVRKQIANLGLQSGLRKNGNQFAIDEHQETLILQAFFKKSETENGNQTETENHEVSDLVSVLQTTIVTLHEQLRVKDKQIDHLQDELEKELEHNREKDRQLLDTLSKLAETQVALAVGQSAEKQKILAETLILGHQKMDEEDEEHTVPSSDNFEEEFCDEPKKQGLLHIIWAAITNTRAAKKLPNKK